MLQQGKQYLWEQINIRYPAENLSAGVDTKRAFRENTDSADNVVEPVRLFRGAEEYERIRIAVSRASKRPVVFLFTIGNPAMRKARAQFSCNFFGCAGYKIIDNPGFGSIEEGIVSFLASEADILVICSSDDEYIVYAPEIYSQLKDSVIIVVAGNPASAEELRVNRVLTFLSILGLMYRGCLIALMKGWGLNSELQIEDNETKIQI